MQPMQDKENGALLFKLACLSQGDTLNLSQYSVAASNDPNRYKSGVQMQMHILNMLYDKLWRLKPEQAIKEVLAVLLVRILISCAWIRKGCGKGWDLYFVFRVCQVCRLELTGQIVDYFYIGCWAMKTQIK